MINFTAPKIGFVLPNTSGNREEKRKNAIYANMYIFKNATPQTIPTGTYTKLIMWDGIGAEQGATSDTANGHIDIMKDGVYLITINASFSGSGSVEWTGGVFLNNGATQVENIQISRKLGASGDVGAVSATGLVNLSAGDLVEVWFKQDSGVNKNINVIDASLTISKIN